MTARDSHAGGIRSRRFAGTLRTRIILWYSVVITCCIAAFSLTAGISFSEYVAQDLDRRVHEDIELAARAIVIDSEGNPAWPGGFLEKQIAEEEGGGHWVEVWDSGGRRRLSAGTFDPKLPDHQPLRGPLTYEIAGGPVRVMSEHVTAGGTRYLVRAAVSELPARRQIRSLWARIVVISLGILILGGLGGIALTHRLMGPLGRMAMHARRITAEQLHERLDVRAAGEELEQLGDAFNATLARLEASFAQLRRFTADASHEIRTPLTVLRSVGEVALQGDKSEAEYREVIGAMLEEVDRLSRLADDLLAIARAEAGQKSYKFESVDLWLLAGEVVEQLGVLAEERGQSLSVDGEPTAIDGDRLSLRQALVNLVDNAIKYSPEGARVTVRVRGNAEFATLAVDDEGPGIAPEHAEKIFERFYRVDRSRAREIGGTGLGLSLVKLTAEAHGGKAEVASTVGRGSTFKIIFPLRHTGVSSSAPAR